MVKLASLRRLPAWLRISPWIVMALAVFLTGLVIAFSGHNSGKAREFASRINLERGVSVIRAFEAAVNVSLGMRWTEDELLRLIEEMGDQPDISYLAVTDQNGVVLAASKEELTDKPLLDAPTFAALMPSDKARITLRESDGATMFLIYKEFKLRSRKARHPRHHRMTPQGMGPGAPEGGPRRDMAYWPPQGPAPDGAPLPALPEMGGMRHAHGRQCRWLPPAEPGAGHKRIVFVAYDGAALERALALDRRHVLLMSGGVFMLGFAGLLSLFLAHSYMNSRRLLQEMRAFSNEVTDNLPVGVLSVDAGGLVTYANPEALRIGGLTGADITGKSPELLLDQAWEHVSRELSEGRNMAEYETWLLNGNDRRVPVAISASRVVTEEGRHISNVVLARDLGEVKKLQNEVRRRDRLVSLGNMAAGIAHELRNPLSSIKGLARYFTEQARDNAAAAKAGEVMTQEIERLDRVVGGLLDLARPDQLIMSRVSLPELVERARRLADSDLRDKNITFETDFSACPREALLDADRLIQALLNLFLNAVQAMESGGALRVRAAEEGENLLLEISDTGSGMSEEQIAQIFSPYFTTKAGGSGLGLALVLKIVEAHDGGIEVRSRPGRGTVFAVRLPQVGLCGGK